MNLNRVSMEMTVTTFTALDEEKWKCKFNTLGYSFSFYCSFLPLLSRVNGNVAMLSNFEVLYCLAVVDRSSLVVVGSARVIVIE